MKVALPVIAAVAVAAAVGAGIYMVDIQQTKQASLPTVTVEGGNLPEYDATVGSVDIVDETVIVPVPNVEVTTEDTIVTMPSLRVTPPAEGAAANNDS